MDERYLPHDRDGRLFRLVEEIGEVAQAIGKMGRFGSDNHHPDRPGLTNAAHLLCELGDLKHALAGVERDLLALPAVKRGGTQTVKSQDAVAFMSAFEEGLSESAYEQMMPLFNAVPINVVYDLIREALDAGADAVLLALERSEPEKEGE